MARRKRENILTRRSSQSPLLRVLRRCGVWVVLAVALLLVLVLIAYYRLLAYVQGDDFRRELANAARNECRAEEVQIPYNLLLNANRISLPFVAMRRGDALQQFQAEGIKAEINRAELMDNTLKINKLSIESSSLLLNADKTGAPLPLVKTGRETFFSRFMPRRILWDVAECRDADIRCCFRGEEYGILGCNMQAAPVSKRGSGDGEWQINLADGKVRIPLSFLQDAIMKSAVITCTPQQLMANECRFSLTPGELRVDAVYERKSERWSADLRVNKANVARILTQDWKKRLHGELFGKLSVRGCRGDLQKATGYLSLQGGVLEGLPVLSSISLDHTRPYRTLELEKAECRISFPYSEQRLNIDRAWLIDQVELRAKGGLLLVRGHVIIGREGNLGGTLNIGIPEAALNAFPAPVKSSVELLASSCPLEEGYVWVNMNLSGSLLEPREDLSVRLSTIVREMPGRLGRQVADAAQGVFQAASSDSASSVVSPRAEEGKKSSETSEPSRVLHPATEAAGEVLQNVIFSLSPL